MTINGGIFVLQQVYNKQISKVWPTKAPAISSPITNFSTIDEGDSVVVNIGTIDYEGQTLYWTIQGISGTIDSSDFTAISGSFVVASNNFGHFNITTTEDVTTEGTESFIIQIRTDSISGPIKATSSEITINDTSIYNAPYGWFGGGAPGPVSRVDRITFASDTVAATTRGPLNSARRAVGATGNKNFGWFGGGTAPAYRSIIDRITFATDSSTAALRGPLSLAKEGIDGSSNDNFGWFGAGFTSTGGRSTVDRITFASDGSTATVRGPLSIARGFIASTGNSNYGWFGGGNPGATPISLVDRIEFAVDTATASVRGPLFYRAQRLSATGNQDYGWFAGGQFSFPAENQLSSVARINFADDTATAPSRTTLSVARNSLSATGNNDYGWFGGGGGTIPTSSIVERITFADDTATTSTRGPLSSVRYGMGSTSGGV